MYIPFAFLNIRLMLTNSRLKVFFKSSNAFFNISLVFTWLKSANIIEF